MVFESIVVDLLNRLLGDYFENLDTSQLKLGIWGGDVVLRNLLLRNSALDDMNVPFKIVVGKLGSLTMKIPWQNLYSAPVELKLQNLLLLIAPSYSVKYDADAEEKASQFAKKKEIERIDEIRRKEQAKKLGETKPQADDTFTEKLITQIIKNVQIKIETIHLRYEDDVTKPNSPFGFGVTLRSLQLQTTDTEWIPTVLTDAAEQTFNKLAELESLALYWNSKTELVNQQDRSPSDMLDILRDFVESENAKVNYVLGPINSKAKLTLTPSPDRGSEPFSKPKFLIDVIMEELGLGMTNLQFQDIIELAESIDFMFRAQLYRKYRPTIKEHQGHHKEWWKYAYQCIVEEDIRRKRNNWDWNHMKRHRNLCKTYANVYYQKLTQTKLKSEVLNTLNHCEMELDLFNITLVRKQVEMKIEKEGKKREAEKQKAAGGGGWFSGWGAWMSGSSTPAESKDLTMNEILEKVEEALTPAEKSKLYAAIDYTENALPLEYPDEYIEYSMSFTLVKLSTIIREFGGRDRHGSGRKILQLEVADVETKVTTRPVKNGMKVVVTLASLSATGLQSKSGGVVPSIITSKLIEDGTPLFNVEFEANPLNSKVDQRVVVRGMPIEVVYDGKTVAELVKCFTLPQDAKLTKLQAAAVSTINDWKEQSTAGLQYMLDTRGELEVDIHLLAPYFLVPQGGLLRPDTSILVLDLGAIEVKSKRREKNWDKDKISGLSRKMFESEEQYLAAMTQMVYDTFIIELRDFQIFIALSNEDYWAAISKTKPKGNKTLPKTLIQASKFVVTLEQSLIPDDPRFPRLQLHASLPLLDLDITEFRLLELLKLLVTLPFPHTDEPATPSLSVISENPAVAESYAISKITYSDSALQKKEKKVVEFVEMMVKFTVDAVKIRITQIRLKSEVPLADFEMNHLKLRLKSKTFSTSIDVGIGGLTLCALQNKIPNQSGPLYLLKTPMSEGSDKHLLKMHMYSILPNCPPEFASKIKQSIKADISSLDVILHQEAIASMLGLIERVSHTIAESIKSNSNNEARLPDTISLRSTSSTESRRKHKSSTQISRLEARRRAVVKKHNDPNDILLQIDAKMESLTVQMSYEKKNLIKAVLSKMDFSMLQKTGKMSISLELTNLHVKNLDPLSLYKDIITVDEDRVVYIKVMMFDEGSTGKNFYDMSKHDMSIRVDTGSPKIVYISPFVDEILTFITMFGTTREAMLEASAAAAAAAKENVEQAVAASSRILLNISLNAPLVIIPRNEQSPHGLLADLGQLKLKNEFEKRRVGEAETYIIVDKMQIDLMNIKVSRIFFDKSQQHLKSEVLILEPVNCKFWMDRNLSSDWYHGLPSLVIKGTIRAATMRMSNEDYDLMLGCIFENIVAPSPSQAVANSDVRGKQKSKTKVVDVNKKDSTGSMRTLVSADTAKSEIYIDMQTYMTVPQLKFVMYQQGVVKLEENAGVVERDDDTAFACVTVQNVSLNFESFNNGNMICPIIIENITLMDIRPGSRAIKSLIQRRDDKTTASATSPILNFNYKKTENAGTTMELETTSLTLVLALDYLMQIINFFQTNGPSAEPPKQDVSLRLEPTAALDPIPAREITAAKPGDAAREDSPPSETFNGFYNLSSTEIILVETMDSIDTKALLLKCEVVFKQTEADGKSNIMGTVSNLKLNSCIYDPAVRESSSAEVISPMSVTVVWNSSQATGSLIDVNISDIFIRLTAGTLELLVKIFGSLNASANSDEDNQTKDDYSDVWDVKDVSNTDYWFLRPDAWYEVGQDALTVEEVKPSVYQYAADLETNERLVLESGAIVFTFETGSGNNTMPMLLIETNIDLQMFDWSKYMKLAGRMKFEAAYYNAMFGMWEFIIEPVENRHHGRVSHQPWEVLFEYTVGPNSTSPNSTPTNVVGSTTTSVILQSNDVLELTVTKTALAAINIISEEFSSAVKELVSKREVSTAAYSVVNNTGLDIKLILKDKGRSGPFILIKNGMEYEEVILKHGTSINLGLIEETDITRHHTSVLREQEGKSDRLLTIEIPEAQFKNSIPVNRSAKRYFPLTAHVDHGHYGLICDIGVKDCSKVVTLRGVVQVVNDLEVPVDVYYMADGGKTAKLAGSALPNNTFDLSIPCTYTQTCSLFFAPEGYSVTTQPFKWDDVFREIKIIKNLSCSFRKAGHDDFHIRVVGVAKQALHECSNRKNIASQCCFIYLKPPVVLDNLLPVPIGYYVDQRQHRMKTAERGSAVHVTNLIIGKDDEYHLYLNIPDYHEQSWRGDIVINKNTPDLSPWIFHSEENVNDILTLGIHREIINEEVVLHVYCPFWMINRTGLDLIYKGDVRDSPQVVHVKKLDTPVMFSFNGKGFFSKKTAHVKVQDMHIRNLSMTTDWSERFSLEAAGSCGSVTCKAPMQTFQIGVEIQLSSWGLTRYVIFTPRFFLANQCPYSVYVVEVDRADDEIEVPAGKCIPFWPKSSTPHMKAIVKILKRRDETQLFRYDMVEHTLLQLSNEYGGLHVDIALTESKTSILFDKFVPGQAPVILINKFKDLTVEFTEKESQHTFSLKPGKCQYFTWKNPLGSRMLQWWPAGKQDSKKYHHENNLLMDGCGNFNMDGNRSGGDRPAYYWISFLDGHQRTLMFIEDSSVVQMLQTREVEVPHADYTVTLHGLGLSLVDNETLKEVMYMRIASSEVIWEQCKDGKRKRFKPLSIEDSAAVEIAYQNYLNHKAIAKTVKSLIRFDSGLEVDLYIMRAIKPHPATIRRVFQTGIWISYKTLPHSTQLHAKLNRIQIDNQLPDSVFHVVLAPVKPPKSVSSIDTAAKPFVEISIMQRTSSHSYVVQYKYFKILVQEFLVRLDIGFVNSLVELFGGNNAAVEEWKDKYMKEYEEVCTPLDEYFARQIVAQGQKHFYDYLHFSPLKIHVSFSMSGSTNVSNHFLKLILASLGVTLTEIQDVVFKLACFELHHTFLSTNQLQDEVYSHYWSQGVRQLYVIVFGLDVIGNPYGLAMGVAKGVEAFFYEPFQGAIQGPGEFAEGVALGVKSLLGGTIGGTAGAFSKITGTLGKGIAALTFDDDYQKKRRENLQNRGDAAEGLARSGKGLVMGFYEGLTGIITKPVEGVKEEGAAGFFKGFAKGTVGLVTRPAAGVVDFASGSFDAVKKATSSTEDTRRLRPPRYIPPDTILTPYICHEAEGVQLLNELEKGKYASTDNYVAHALINPHGIYVVLVTNRRVLYLKRDELFGTWATEWNHIWEDFACPPEIVERGLLFTLRQEPVKKIVLFKVSKSKKLLVPIYSAEVATWLVSKIEEAMRVETGMAWTDDDVEIVEGV